MARQNKELGRFQLTGIRRAPRGVPQIEVTFSIDANGIVNVSAKDLDTGKAQAITITATSNMSREEIDRAVRDAQQYAAEDEKLKAEAVAKDRCEHLLYKAASVKPADKEQKAAIAEAAKTVKRAIKSRDSAQMVSAADQLESLLQQAGVNMDEAGSYQGSYENPNNSSRMTRWTRTLNPLTIERPPFLHETSNQRVGGDAHHRPGRKSDYTLFFGDS